jgi:limonene 1,2-monooxygenase
MEYGMSLSNLKFGIYLSPFHSLKENPTIALERDIELIELLDRLDYDYAWIGENHSAGFEIIASPEVFIAAAAQRTKRIKFGACISSLPYHHPLILADRIMQLDHMTRGRVAFAVGPGSLRSDASMMGVSHTDQQVMMFEAIEVLVALLRGEKVSRKTKWFELIEAQLQLQPYSKPMVEMAVTSQFSPAGAQLAGTFGLGLLSIDATSASGFNALSVNWEIYQRKAAENKQAVDHSNRSLVAPMHIAESREQALNNVQSGIKPWIKYFQEVAGVSIVSKNDTNAAKTLVDSGMAIIGTPQDAIRQIKRLQTESGGFGSFLQMAHNWADWEHTQKSYELFARYVSPIFQRRNQNRKKSYKRTVKNRDLYASNVVSDTPGEIDMNGNSNGERTNTGQTV